MPQLPILQVHWQQKACDPPCRNPQAWCRYAWLWCSSWPKCRRLMVLFLWRNWGLVSSLWSSPLPRFWSLSDQLLVDVLICIHTDNNPIPVSSPGSQLGHQIVTKFGPGEYDLLLMCDVVPVMLLEGCPAVWLIISAGIVPTDNPHPYSLSFKCHDHPPP